MSGRDHSDDRDASFEVSEHSQGVIADFVNGLEWERLDVSVQAAARLCVLDALGAMLVGTLTPVARVTADYAARTWPGDEATVYASGYRTSVLGAAFANGSATNGTDIDDCGIYTWGHPGAQLVPTALAMCEAGEHTGQALLESLVVGYEIAFRAGRCNHDFHDLYRSCGSWGAVACAAVAARLMRLSPSHTLQALGIADYDSPILPMMRDVDHPAMVKHGIGLGALTGIMSAQLAECGFTGTPALMTSEMYADWVGDLGARYLIAGGVTWKRHSCCAWTHPALLAVQKLRELHSIPIEKVARIEIETYEEACRLHVRLPHTTEEAQFSLPWVVAAMLIDGELGPDQVLDRRLQDPAIRRLAACVETHADAELTRLHALTEDFEPEGIDAATVRIELDDGSVVDSGLVDMAVRPMSRGEVEGKFRRIARRVLADKSCEQVIELVNGLESESSVAALVDVLQTANPYLLAHRQGG